ncbi:primosomal protein N' [Variibacter gotjawalensis]|uniref:Replication restart protein PriA n=1 Tax=Variibacter gotjawalensis TaxID=1333996 RepID=A0A0S3PRS2_9BRAD|nr:primosomal protein N' [Variibacter gotjawalensis]NIK48949.1 primosomal protein N' (replication factor Y) [Variibacter gotjawalensis]RZS50805.1 replication restart DNA helicase PriA [Variibacter gotjawalensis]BAT58639.1 primosomal protein N' [Variibacter gotjawalensis]
MTAKRIVDVLVPVALDHPYSYGVPRGMTVETGQVVRVPLGPRESTGVVWGEGEWKPGLHNRLKDITDIVPVPPLTDELRGFVDWLSNYTLSPRGMVLRMALRMNEHLGPERERVGIRLAGPKPQRMTPARGRVLRLLEDGFVRPKGEAAREAGVSPSVIDGLVDDGALEAVALKPEPIAETPDPTYDVPTLTAAQEKAAGALREAVKAETFAVTLLDGVTGSGKTDVYFEAVAQAVRAGRQTLILMPEIALTNAFLDRFAARFGVRPAEWHSQVAPRRRARTWAGIASGEIPVVVGARSALFLPFVNPGLIIVDEEHDAVYKQEDGVHYHARDMAVVRARIANVPIILSSATPSVETEVNARKSRYTRLSLPERFGGQQMPHMEAIDLKREGPIRGRYIAPRLAEAVGIAIERGEQALLFLNRRGYAPLTLCRGCGHRLQCPNCDAWLVEHRFRRQLSCHHCGFTTSPPKSCPKCNAVDSFVAVGPGVERLEEEVASLFPNARAMVLSSDLIVGVERMQQEFAEIAEGRVDIVVGTQLVAKGHHFPKLNLVGVVDADMGLGQGDPRAAERTFQLLHQVAGRAGRETGQGHGFLQTHQPEHPVIRALLSGDREAFYGSEIASREKFGYPPFGRLASLVVTGADKHKTEAHAKKLVALAPSDPAVRILGPAEAPLALVRGRHRYRVLIKSPRAFDLSGYMRDWIALAPKMTGGIKREVDIDPQSFL